MNIFDSIILGVVEGITEFLPVSSTGHLILAGEVLNIPQTEFLKTFDIFIQLGALMAVLILYYRSFCDFKILRNIFIGFLPTAFIGFTFYKVVKEYLFGSQSIILWALFLGGIIMIFVEYFLREEKIEKDVSSLSIKDCLMIGFFQSIAIIPGVSRSGATIVGGLIYGIPRNTIIKYSFLLAVPTIAAATGLDLIKTNINFSLNQILTLFSGFATSFVVALVAVKLLEKLAKKNVFIFFGLYRIAIAIVLFFAL